MPQLSPNAVPILTTYIDAVAASAAADAAERNAYEHLRVAVLHLVPNKDDTLRCVIGSNVVTIVRAGGTNQVSITIDPAQVLAIT